MGPGLVRRVAVETEEGVEAALDSVLGAGSGAGGADKGETKEDEGRGGGGKTKKRGR